MVNRREYKDGIFHRSDFGSLSAWAMAVMYQTVGFKESVYGWSLSDYEESLPTGRKLNGTALQVPFGIPDAW